MSAICEKMYHDPEFRKVHDRFAETHNNLADKLNEVGIEIKYLDDVIKAVSDYENYASTFLLNLQLSELNIMKEANINE